MRTKLGRRLGWEAGKSRSEDPRETWLWAGLQGKAEGTGNPWGEKQGSPKEGKECPSRLKGGQRTRREGKKKDQEDVGFLFGLANVCSPGQAQC